VVVCKERRLLVVVSPDRAACLYESALAGKPVKVEHGEATIMAMLECYEPSLVAWRVLSRTADAFMTIGEDDAAEAIRRLARPLAGDPAIVAGESGGAGFGGLQVALKDKAFRDKLGLDAQSRIFLINTEGATDQARYESIVGASPEAVLAATK
jgi:diaminopropionate ammonia-lyase